jgi:hypothetical protein
MKYIKLYEEYTQDVLITGKLIKFLHEGVRMMEVQSLNESKYPELKRLLDNAKKDGKELLITEFVPEIEALVDKFGQSGQSGGSAPYTAGAIVDTIKKMLAHEPLGEGIMGTDDEWNDCSMFEDAEAGTGSFQNNRLSSVFKEGKEGKPYYLNSIVFKPVGKNYTFTSGGGVGITEGSDEVVGSFHYIKEFPFQPKTFVIDVHEKEYRKLKDGSLVEEEGGGWWESWLANPKQLDEVWEYYDKREKKK